MIKWNKKREYIKHSHTRNLLNGRTRNENAGRKSRDWWQSNVFEFVESADFSNTMTGGYKSHATQRCHHPFGKTVEIQSEICLGIGHFYSNAIEAPLVPSRYLRSKMPPEVPIRSNFTVLSRIYITLPHRCTWFSSDGFEVSFKDVPRRCARGNWDRLDGWKCFFFLVVMLKKILELLNLIYQIVSI